MQLFDLLKYFEQTHLNCSNGIRTTDLVTWINIKLKKLRRAGVKEMTDQNSSAFTPKAHLQKVSLRRKTPKIDWKQYLLSTRSERSASSHTRNESYQQNIGSNEV